MALTSTPGAATATPPAAIPTTTASRSALLMRASFPPAFLTGRPAVRPARPAGSSHWAAVARKHLNTTTQRGPTAFDAETTPLLTVVEADRLEPVGRPNRTGVAHRAVLSRPRPKQRRDGQQRSGARQLGDPGLVERRLEEGGEGARLGRQAIGEAAIIPPIGSPSVRPCLVRRRRWCRQ